MEVNTLPNPARGEVVVSLAGQPQTLRFNLRTLHDHTTATGTKLADLGAALIDDTFAVIGGLVAAAVRCTTGKPFTTGEALDLLSDLPEAENVAVAAAVVKAIRLEESPLYKALMSQLPQSSAPATSGSDTTASPLAS